MSVKHRNASEAQLQIAFCSTDPELTKYPHCVFRNSNHPVKVVSEVVNDAAGVWGEWWLVDESGEQYLGPDDGRIIDGFKLWTLPKNQEYALNFTGRGSGFSMVISAGISADVLRRIYDIADEEDGEFIYDKYIIEIAKLIPEIGWAYIPLYDSEYAIFVTSPQNAHYVRELGNRLRDAGNTQVFNVTPTDSGQKWNGPIIWDPEAFFGPTDN